MNLDKKFARYSSFLSSKLGTPRAFFIAMFFVISWVSLGPLFNFSDTWQLVINSVTNIGEFLMLFLIQNTQNRDAAALQIKLDELIRSNRSAHNALLDIESLTETQLEIIRQQYIDLARLARKKLGNGQLPDPDEE